MTIEIENGCVRLAGKILLFVFIWLPLTWVMVYALAYLLRELGMSSFYAVLTAWGVMLLYVVTDVVGDAL